MSQAQFCICIPACNEVDRLPILLDALAAQISVGTIPVAVCVNNSTDGTAAAAAAAAVRHTGKLDITIDDCTFPPARAHAGSARGRAMDMGYARIAGSGLLISTDADCRPPSDWIAANLAAHASGASVIGGRIVLDDAEPIAPAIVAMQARFDAYWSAVRAIEDAIDPSPNDPPPRHGDHTGASLAISATLFRSVGGVPPLPSGEDRALVVAAVAAGGRLAHPPTVWTRVSARTDGRAVGGMAVAMADLARRVEQRADPQVPAFAHWTARAHWRRTERMIRGAAAMLALEERLPPMPMDMALPALLA